MIYLDVFDGEVLRLPRWAPVPPGCYRVPLDLLVYVGGREKVDLSDNSKLAQWARKRRREGRRAA